MTDFVAELDRRAAERLSGALRGRLAACATGHAPRVAIVACADARVMPEAVFGLEPNEAVVVRSAGNLALPGGGQFSTLLLAITACAVRDVIVLGHSDCSAMGCLFDSELGSTQDELVEHMLRCDPALDAAVASSASVEILAQENVRHQLPILRTALAERGLGEVRVHGRYLDFAAGRVLAIE